MFMISNNLRVGQVGYIVEESIIYMKDILKFKICGIHTFTSNKGMEIISLENCDGYEIDISDVVPTYEEAKKKVRINRQNMLRVCEQQIMDYHRFISHSKDRAAMIRELIRREYQR